MMSYKLKKAQVELKINDRLFITIFSLPFLLLGLIQLLGGFSNSFYIFKLDFKNLYITAAWIVLIVTWLSLLYWIWIGNGVKVLIKYRKAFNNFPDNPILVKAMTTFIIVSSAIGFIVCSALNLSDKVEQVLPKEKIHIKN